MGVCFKFRWLLMFSVMALLSQEAYSRGRGGGRGGGGRGGGGRSGGGGGSSSSGGNHGSNGGSSGSGNHGSNGGGGSESSGGSNNPASGSNHHDTANNRGSGKHTSNNDKHKFGQGKHNNGSSHGRKTSSTTPSTTARPTKFTFVPPKFKLPKLPVEDQSMLDSNKMRITRRSKRIKLPSMSKSFFKPAALDLSIPERRHVAPTKPMKVKNLNSPSAHLSSHAQNTRSRARWDVLQSEKDTRSSINLRQPSDRSYSYLEHLRSQLFPLSNEDYRGMLNKK